MVVQKRPLPQPSESHRSEGERNGNGGEGPRGSSVPNSPKSEQEQVELAVRPEQKAPEEVEEEQEQQLQRGEEEEELPSKDEQGDDPDHEDGESHSSPSAAAIDDNGFVLVKLAEIRKEVQCPICLGIIKKTRTVMECLHRFCRDCIDKSMRLGNNECPACRTHCASRRSLRDDPNYDSLIAALYPDIEKYEEEESAFQEEEKIRNRKIQTSIAATLRRQTEALGRKRPIRNIRRGRNQSYLNFRGSQGSDDDEGVNANEWEREPTLLDEPCPDVRPKRYKRSSAPRASRSLATGDADDGCEGNEDGGDREIRSASPARAGNREVLVWGKGGARSQTRHGGSGGINGKNIKGGRLTKLVDYLRNYAENDSELDMHLTLLPMDDQSIPALDRPYLCCRPTLSIRHICQFLSLQTSIQAEEIEILVRKPQGQIPELTSDAGDRNDPSENEYQTLGAQESLADLHDCFSFSRGNVVLVYRTKLQGRYPRKSASREPTP